MEVSSKYGYSEKKKPRMNGLSEGSQKNLTNGHETNESSDCLSSGEDNHQMNSQKEISSGTSNSSSRDGISGQSGSLSQDGVPAESRRSSQNGMVDENGMSVQGEMSSQEELQLQQDGSGRVQSRKQRTFTPEVSKDTSYWEKRRKNNEAARRSREKRRQYDMARERSVHDVSAQNKYLIRQLCILKHKFGIPVSEPMDCPMEYAEQIDRDSRALLAALLSNDGHFANIAGSSVNLGLHCKSPNNSITSGTSYSDMPNQSSMNGERQNLYNLSPADSVASSYSIKSFKSEPVQQPMTSRLKYDMVSLSMIKQEPQEEYPNPTYINSNAPPRSVDNMTNSSEMFENSTSGINMVRDSGDLLMNGRRSFSTSPSQWYPAPLDHSGVGIGRHGPLTNGLNLTNHANGSTPSPSSSSSSIHNYPIHNGHNIPQLPPQQENDEPLQLTVNKRTRMDSETSSEVMDPVEDPQWNRNSRNLLSSPTVNSNSHLSAHSLPLKLRHKASLPDHTIALTHSLTPTTMISSTAFGNSSLANLNHHSQSNGLSHLSDMAHSQNGPLPLLKRDSNGQLLYQRNSPSKENDVTCVGSSDSFTENGRISPSDDDLSSSQYSGSKKDNKYFERRRRNNEAARKCRENRKTLHQMREAQTSYFEMQNNHLKVKVAQQREELGRLQVLLKKKQEAGTLNNNKGKNNDNGDGEDHRNNKKLM